LNNSITAGYSFLAWYPGHQLKADAPDKIQDREGIVLTGSASPKGAQYKKYIIRFAHESSIDSPSAHESSISLPGSPALWEGLHIVY